MRLELDNGITITITENKTVASAKGHKIWSVGKDGIFKFYKLKWQEIAGNIVCPICGFSCDDEHYLDEKNYCPDCGTRLNWGNENESTITD